MADLVPVRQEEQLPAFAPAEMDSARRYRDASRADSTRAKYAADWRAFSAWCQERGHPALPAHPGAVAVYLLRSPTAAARPPPSAGCSPPSATTTGSRVWSRRTRERAAR